MKHKQGFLKIITIFFSFPEKRVDYSHGFSSAFFFDTPEVTKTVLPKVLQNPKLYLLVQVTEPKRFSFIPRIIQYRTRLKGPPFSFFSTLRDFFRKKFPKVPPSIFWSFATEWMLKNPKGFPLSFFGIGRLFKKIWGAVEENTLTL